LKKGNLALCSCNTIVNRQEKHQKLEGFGSIFLWLLIQPSELVDVSEHILKLKEGIDPVQA
jgi:O-glycosyl hydrolase